MEQGNEPPADDPGAPLAPASNEGHPEAQEGGAVSSDEEHTAAEGVKKTKKTPRLMKTTWILTYGASGPYITPQMLRELGKIEVDECHSTKDRVMSFTYIHLTKRVRQSSIEKFMKKAKESHGIVQNSIYGYESVACISRQDNDIPIEEHVGFQMLLRHYVAKNPAFVPWTDGEPVLKRGRILKAAEIDPARPATMETRSKAQIIAYAKHLESKLKDVDAERQSHLERYNTMSRDHAQLSTENFRMSMERSTLRSENAALIHERTDLRIENAALKRKIQELESTHD